MTSVLYTLVPLVIGVAIGLSYGRARQHHFQNSGEARLSIVTRKHFRAPDYHLMNHVTLPLREGSTQVDHILVSRFGVFVIETKDYKGWIFASANRTSWTQVLFNRKFKFQNPILQNQLHVRTVRELLDFLPANAVRSVVVFTGQAEFKTDVPTAVFSLSGFVDHIRGHVDEIMSINRMQFCVGRLETARLALTMETDVEHVESLRRRRGEAE